jgi:hypothetical protein
MEHLYPTSPQEEETLTGLLFCLVLYCFIFVLLCYPSLLFLIPSFNMSVLPFLPWFSSLFSSFPAPSFCYLILMLLTLITKNS